MRQRPPARKRCGPLCDNIFTVPTPAEIGDALHDAVRAIELHILATSPSLKESTFVFEDKKVVIVGGVRHEIDIFVTIQAAPGYSSVHIFECKNWKKSVGKTEILDFSAKISDVNAAHGYFVAKSFTRYARAQAKQDGRMTLLIATKHDPTGFPIPNDLHSIAIVPYPNVNASFYRRGRSSEQLLPFAVDSAHPKLHGAEINFLQYLTDWAQQAIAEDSLAFPSGKLGAGSYDREACSTRKFAIGEFLLNDADVEMAVIFAPYRVTVYRPPIISVFDVESRGRFLAFADIVFPKGEVFRMRIVQRPDAFPKG